MHRLAKTFVERPDEVLKELVELAVELTGADSAGISLESGTDQEFYHWVASAGAYSEFLNALLPRYPSACGICLERGKPQSFRVHPRFFELLGVSAPSVTDGLLLPWRADGTEGTIFVMAHGRTEAFDIEDCKLMEALANSAALAIRQSRLRRLELEQERTHAARGMAHDLAHEVNNPLQGITNQLYLAEQSDNEGERRMASQLLPEFDRLNSVTRRHLGVPTWEHSQLRSTPDSPDQR